MNSTKFFSVALAMLFSTAITFLTPSFANTSVSKTTILASSKDGGPRDIVLKTGAVVVTQQEPEYLEVTIKDEYGTTVYQGITVSTSIQIPTTGWESGGYIAHTIDLHENYQPLNFTLQ